MLIVVLYFEYSGPKHKDFIAPYLLLIAHEIFWKLEYLLVIVNVGNIFMCLVFLTEALSNQFGQD